MNQRAAGLLATTVSAVSLVFGVAGCSQYHEPTAARSDADVALFGPVAMRLHPIFTQVKSWTGTNKPDGVEALVELQDQFGDPTKASGRVQFALYDYRPYDPERRGDRIARWDGYLETLDEQRDRWNRTSRTYAFQLAYPTLQANKSYVVTAQFDLTSGGRFFATLILEGQLPNDPNAATALPPSTMPTTVPTTAPSVPLQPNGQAIPGSPPVLAPGNEPANSPTQNHQP